MTKQPPGGSNSERSARTRRALVKAAASTFDEVGYEAASLTEILARARVTKGAMYFHFSSKEDLARAVLREQTADLALPPSPSKLQAVIDLTLYVADAMQNDPLIRSGARLALDQGQVDFSDASPFRAWTAMCERLLAEAREAGEIFAEVDPAETAALIVGAFTGIQAVSRVATNRADLLHRIVVMWRHLLPGLAGTAALPTLSLSEDRARDIARQVRESAPAESLIAP